jgi:hypothetical protein
MCCKNAYENMNKSGDGHAHIAKLLYVGVFSHSFLTAAHLLQPQLTQTLVDFLHARLLPPQHLDVVEDELLITA